MYIYDRWQCIEEREFDENGEEDDAWEPRRQYIYGGTYIDEPLLFDKDTGTDGVMDIRYFYCQQANYNVVAVTDSAGAIVEKIKYDPYGEATFAVGGTIGNPYLFQGRRWDSEADLYYFRNRSYSPRLGRFLQRDPAGYGDGMNLYEFVGGGPTQALDPRGLGWYDTVVAFYDYVPFARTLKSLMLWTPPGGTKGDYIELAVDRYECEGRDRKTGKRETNPDFRVLARLQAEKRCTAAIAKKGAMHKADLYINLGLAGSAEAIEAYAAAKLISSTAGVVVLADDVVNSGLIMAKINMIDEATAEAIAEYCTCCTWDLKPKVVTGSGVALIAK